MIIAAIIFILLGFLIKNMKMYFLIAGYNSLPKAKQAEYKIEEIATVFRNVMYAMALVIVAGYFIARMTENSSIENYLFWFPMIVGLPYLLIETNSNKYKK